MDIINSDTYVTVPRLPRSVLEVSKKMLTESSKNSMAAIVENEAGWLLLSSLLASMPKEVSCFTVIFVLLALLILLSSFHAHMHTCPASAQAMHAHTLACSCPERRLAHNPFAPFCTI